jgi:hypothetical protein
MAPGAGGWALSKPRRDLLNNLALLISNTTMIIGVVLVGYATPSIIICYLSPLAGNSIFPH